MFVKSTVAVALLASFVAAQNDNITFAPSTVDLTIRNQWCQAEFNTCNILCGKRWNANNCTAETLAYTCLCTSNNSQPGLIYYTQTMPTFICEQNFKVCNAAAVNQVNSAAAQAACKATEQSQCGQFDASNITVDSVSSTSSAGPTPTGSGTAGGSSATSTSSKAAAATMAAMRNFGTGVFAIGAGVVFGAIL